MNRKHFITFLLLVAACMDTPREAPKVTSTEQNSFDPGVVCASTNTDREGRDLPWWLASPLTGYVDPNSMGADDQLKIINDPCNYAPNTYLWRDASTGEATWYFHHLTRGWIPVGLGPKGDTGTNGIGSSITTSTPTRTIGSAGFQPSTTKHMLVSYTLSVDAGLTLTGGAKGRVELRSDSSSTPTTVRCAVGSGNTGTLTIGLATATNATAACSYIVAPSDYVRLVQVNDTGTVTASITAQVEQALNQ